MAGAYSDGQADGHYWASSTATREEIEGCQHWAGKFTLGNNHSQSGKTVDMGEPYWRGFVAGVKQVYDAIR